MTDYESLHAFLGGDRLASRAAQILARRGLASTVAELLALYAEDPDLLCLHEAFGFGPAGIDRIRDRCRPHTPNKGSLREFLGGDAFADRVAHILFRRERISNAEELVRRHNADFAVLLDVPGVGKAAADRIHEVCGSPLARTP